MYSINYLNKDKNFQEDTKQFNNYEDAKNWALDNFQRFSPDMIKVE